MTNEQRLELKQIIDQAKRQEIAVAHGRNIPDAPKITECEWCGAIIPSTRRFCDQDCVNADRRNDERF
jgi:hypothetical protein